jgi:AraC-like DNA-binding protein
MVVVHAAGIKQSHSSIEKINLRWLQYLLSAFVIAWLVTLAIQLSAATPQAFNYSWLLVAVVTFLIGYMGLRQPEIFAGEENLVSGSEGIQKKKYEKSALTADKAGQYLAKLQKLMAAEKPFLDKDLTLNSLAEKLSIPSHHLSQIINESLRQNFFEFVNSHRVEEAKKLLLDPANRHLNLAEIGHKAGFNSVSSFNAVFKKFVQMTPSRYQKTGENHG